MAYPGKYIVIEGGEGSDKSKQANLLFEYLQGINIDCVRCREPGTTKTGERIRKILKNPGSLLTPHQQMELFLEAREDLFKEVIIPGLNSGKVIVADRSGYSTEAYQGYGDGIDLGLIKKLNYKVTQGIRPDLLFIIDVDEKIGLGKETVKDKFSAQRPEYHARVNSGYRQIFQENFDIAVVIQYMEGNISGMHEEIRAKVHERLHI